MRARNFKKPDLEFRQIATKADSTGGSSDDSTVAPSVYSAHLSSLTRNSLMLMIQLHLYFLKVTPTAARVSSALPSSGGDVSSLIAPARREL